MDSAEATYMAQQENERIDETVRAEGGRLLRFIRGRVRTDEDAQDILQDTFSQLVESTRRLEKIEQIGAWLFRVARNKIADLYRKKRPVNQSALTEADTVFLAEILPDLGDSPEDAMMRDVIWEAIQEALDDLPPEQKEVFEWHEFDGMRFKEIAELTGETENTLRLRKYRAVQALRVTLSTLYSEIEF